MTSASGDDGIDATTAGSVMPFSVAVDPDEDALAAYFIDFVAATNRYVAIISGPLAAAAVVAALLGWWALAAVVACAAGLIASPLGRRWWARWRARRHRTDMEPYVLRFSSLGVGVDGVGFRSDVEWSKVQRLIVGADTVILTLGPRKALFAPRSLLTTEQVDALQASMANR